MAPPPDSTEDSFARWASTFVDSFARQVGQGQVTCKYAGVTPAACELLLAVDNGGVPAFVSSGMIAIAHENGIVVPEHWTPNEVIDVLRSRAVRTEE